MSENLHSGAESFLNEFMIKMNKWGIRAYDYYQEINGGPLKNQEIVRTELAEIYDEFLTIKDRKTGNLANPSASMMPEYDPLKEKTKEITSSDGKKVVITTEKIYPENNNYKEIYRYTIVKKSDRFFLDKKEKYSAFKGKWINIVF